MDRLPTYVSENRRRRVWIQAAVIEVESYRALRLYFPTPSGVEGYRGTGLVVPLT